MDEEKWDIDMALKNMLVCSNDECENAHRQVHVGKRELVYREGRFVDKETLYCPKCTAPLVEIEVDDQEGDISFCMAQFNSLNDKQKHDLLKKRSDDHFKKIGRDEKQWRQEKVVKQYLGGD